jgi:alpha-D-xyloside xylohydrolase
LLYQRAVFETTQEVHGYGLIWGRSGYAGAQRYPVHWGGDSGCTFSDMAANLRGALSWVLSGPTFASFDIGGFYGFPNVDDPPSPELYIRWAQMGLLFSHSRAHGHTSAREPWAFGQRALAIFRDYARLRYRLLPYLYSAAQRAPQGTPLARPLVYDYPQDRTTHHLDDQYLLGPDLLVAPMFEAEGERDIYLPSGSWFDYWTDWVFHAGWHRRHVPLEVLPIYVRAGALIPLGPAITSTMEDATGPLTLEAYPHSAGTTEIDVHDERGAKSFRLLVDEKSARVEGASSGEVRVRIHRGSAQPVEANLGEPVPLSPP